MHNRTAFEILVYSADQTEVQKRIEQLADKAMAIVPGKGTEFWQKQWDDTVDRRWRTSLFNELIGAIEVHLVETQLRADYWFTDKKRIVVLSSARGNIGHRGQILEMEYRDSRLSSTELFYDFRRKLQSAIDATPRLVNRFVNLQPFDRCGPFVDWRSLLKLSTL